MLTYIVNAAEFPEHPEVKEKADEFADQLSKLNSNTVPIYLAQYYFQSGNTERAMEMVLKYLNYVASDQNAWNKAFQLLRVYMSGEVAFTQGMREIKEFLETWNESNIGTITLSEADQDLLRVFVR